MNFTLATGKDLFGLRPQPSLELRSFLDCLAVIAKGGLRRQIKVNYIKLFVKK
jgi:hypothetical protein